ncbi:MAG: SAM-dependent methyltransferase, partial [Clostridiales bacterium]|nr:SAM-dependent methyltransferase [Clostridiales bacterium]
MPRIIPFALDERLALCASMIRPGVKMADIGTDHAYLPVWLTRRGICPHAVAADINPRPLRSACQTIEKYRASELVEARLSDGLTGLSPSDADDFVIAGMGGDLIAAILSKVSWIKEPHKRLILQPVKSAEELRRYLYENGFRVEQESLAKAGGRLYPVIAGSFGGEALVPSVARAYGGELLTRDAPFRREYLLHQAGRLLARASGLESAGRGEEEAALCRAAAEELTRC